MLQRGKILYFVTKFNFIKKSAKFKVWNYALAILLQFEIFNPKISLAAVCKNSPANHISGFFFGHEILIGWCVIYGFLIISLTFDFLSFTECLLSGEEQPLLIVDQARLQGKHFCAFAYQRKDSQNAWPTQMGLDLSKPTPTNSSS